MMMRMNIGEKIGMNAVNNIVLLSMIQKAVTEMDEMKETFKNHNLLPHEHILV